MIRDDFHFGWGVVEDRLKLLDLKLAFRKSAKAWASREVSQQCYTENQGAKVNYILITIFAILVSGSNL